VGDTGVDSITHFSPYRGPIIGTDSGKESGTHCGADSITHFSPYRGPIIGTDSSSPDGDCIARCPKHELTPRAVFLFPPSGCSNNRGYSESDGSPYTCPSSR